MKRKYRWLSLLVCVCLFFSGPGVAEGARIVVNNQPLVHMDQESVIIDGRTFVPLRGVFERFGEVSWNAANQTVQVRTEQVALFLIVGSDYAVCRYYANGIETHSDVVYLDRPSWIWNGRVMLPVRFVAEALNAKVEWLQSSKTVYIDTY